MSNYDSIDFFTDQSLVPDPHPLFRLFAQPKPGAAAAALRRRRRHRLRRSHRGLQGPDTFSNIVALGGPFRRCPSNLRATTSAADR